MTALHQTDDGTYRVVTVERERGLTPAALRAAANSHLSALRTELGRLARGDRAVGLDRVLGLTNALVVTAAGLLHSPPSGKRSRGTLNGGAL